MQVGLAQIGVERTQGDFAGESVLSQRGKTFFDSDCTRGIRRKAVYAAGDGRKRDRLQLVLPGQYKARAITLGQPQIFALPATPPDWADSVDDKMRRQVESGRDASFTGWTSYARPNFRDLAARIQELMSGGFMDRPIDTAATQQRFVGSVHDNVDRQPCDVSLDHLDHHDCTIPRGKIPSCVGTMPNMRIEVNGDTREFADGASLAEVLEAEGLAGRRVAIEVNRELVPRSRHAVTMLKHGDRVEIVQAMGGG